MKTQFLYCFTLFNLILLNRPLAQPLATDTAFYTSAKNHVVKLYIDSVKANIRLYNGFGVVVVDRSVLGHPYFEYPESQRGTVFYDGVQYPDMLLSYELIHDELIVTEPVKNLDIQVVPQKIKWFSIQNHFFLNILSDTNTANFPGNGYYELLYEGATAVFSKRKKQFDQSLKADEASKYIQWIWYYVRKDNVYYAIDSRRSLLAVCRDHKTETAKFMQQQKLNFKKDPANTIVKVIDYYTQLKNN